MPKHAAKIPESDAVDSTGRSEKPEGDERDAPIGLTEAFSPVGVEEGAHVGGFAYQGDKEGEYPDALDSLEPQGPAPLLFDDEGAPVEEGEAKGRHGKGGKPPISSRHRKSRRMRRVLIAIVVLLVALIAALGYFTFRLLAESQTLAAQQAQEQQSAQDATASQNEETRDATTATVKKTEVPSLVTVLGMTQDAAVAALQHGATVTVSRDVNEEGSSVKKSVTVVLTDEPADTRSGTPTVYLGLNEAGAVVQAGYSAPTAVLGYGSLSFVDAVRNEHIVEKTLQEAGIPVSEGAAVLPDDKTVYSAYASDGTTLVKENCPFSGTVDLNGVQHEWSAVLVYDYTTANMSGNLADTVRMVYVYINA